MQALTGCGRRCPRIGAAALESAATLKSWPAPDGPAPSSGACPRRSGRRLAVLAPVGRMALTNYLLQSVMGVLVFYGYGLGLMGKLGSAAQIGVALALFTV